MCNTKLSSSLHPVKPSHKPILPIKASQLDWGPPLGVRVISQFLYVPWIVTLKPSLKPHVYTYGFEQHGLHTAHRRTSEKALRTSLSLLTCHRKILRPRGVHVQMDCTESKP